MSDLNELVSSFTAAYKNHSASKITDLCYLPDKNCIIEMVELLRKLLFPGYFDGSDTDLENGIEFYTGSLLMQTDKILKQQICRALNTNSKENKSCENKDCEVYFSRACELSYIFLGRIPLLRETLLTDVEAAFEGDPAAKSRHEIIFAYPGIFAVSVYRMAHELYLLDVPLIPRIMSEYAHSITGVDIHPGAEIGKSFFIDHGTGVVIGETAKIGDYVKIYQGVTLGALSTKGGQKLRDLKRHPTLEDEVTVYSSASILGGETVVGKGSVIGGNAFITRSVPAYTKVNAKCPQLDFNTVKNS